MATYFGTVINESPTIVMKVGAKITEAQGKALMVSSGTLVSATEGANAIGIVPFSEDDTIESGADVTVQIKDITAWKAGAKVNVGDELTSDANGLATPAKAGNFITAIALTAAAEAGTIIRCQIVKAGYKA